MDVRCEKCGTEYELDETRLKPGGVTVKCTSCGHMFKIRKRANTSLGVPVVPVPAADRAARPSGSPIPRAASSTGAPDSGPNSERNWIIRMANGEQRTCRELATLQQWIISGQVRRDSMISRSGKTWKQLGDIPELAQFFGVAEEARPKRDSGRVTSPQQAQAQKAQKASEGTLLGLGGAPAPGEPAARARPRTQPPPPPKALAGHAGPMAPLPPLASLGGTPANDTRPKTAPPPQPPAAPPPRAQTFSRPAASPSSSPVPSMPALGAAQRSTGAWATENVKPLEQGASGQPDSFHGIVRGNAEGGFVGQVRAVPTHDAAFVSSSQRSARALRGEDADAVEELSSSAMFADDDTGPVMRRRASGGLGKWIALGSLVLIAGAAAAIYFVVVRQPDNKPSAAPVAVVGGDGGAVTPDAGGTTTEPIADDPLAAARDALLGDSVPALTAAGKALVDLPQDAATESLRARLLTARAQAAQDEAVFRDTKTADGLRKEAKKLVAEAMPLAQRSVKTKADDALAQVAMADVLRLQGKPAVEVRRYLDRALQLAADDPEARLVEAMLAERDAKPADARAILAKLEAARPLTESGDVRPRIRLALLAYAANDAPAAQQAAEDVIAVQGDHAAASLLLAKLRDAVATADPMPPEDEPPDAGVAPTNKGSGSGSGTGTSKGTSHSSGGSDSGGDYDTLLAKADRLAEVNCNDAMPYYAKALEVKPNGVAALTGRGYCYIDAKSFSSAHSSFRAALAVSRKYEPALWGIAEAYQQQGLKDKAIEAYQNYLETYPGTAKALKQLEKLGVTSTGGDDPPPSDPPPSDPPPSDPPPAEEPAPSDG